MGELADGALAALLGLLLRGAQGGALLLTLAIGAAGWSLRPSLEAFGALPAFTAAMLQPAVAPAFALAQALLLIGPRGAGAGLRAGAAVVSVVLSAGVGGAFVVAAWLPLLTLPEQIDG